MTAPAGYTVAITRIPLHSVKGAYRLTGRKAQRQGVVGTPVLNVIDGVLSSVTVYPFNKCNKTVRIPAHRVAGLFFAENPQDALTFASFTR